MRALLISAVLLIAVAPAYAQQKTDQEKAQAEKRKVEADQAYKSSLERIPAKEGNADPWGAVRGTTPPADANVSAQTRAKKPKPAPAAQ